jgi:cysteine synthase
MHNITIPKETALTMTTRFHHLWQLVGNTPMVEIRYRYKGIPNKLFAKCEYYNLTGSIKDRMALYILQKAYETGAIKTGDTIVEATSGNTGIAFAAVGRALGHPVTIIMPDWLSRERIDIMKSLGAEVKLVSKQEGGFLGCIALSQEMAEADKRVFLPCQFENYYNAEAHEKTTASEIEKQLKSIGRAADAFVAGVGTGGTVMGVHQYFSKNGSKVAVHPVEPAESPTLTTGYKIGAHRIQGISDEFIPELLRLDKLQKVVQVNDGDAILMAQKLSKQIGLAVGISSGANLVACIKLQETLPLEKTVVTILCDSNKKYLSTDLMRTETVKESYVSTNLDFDGYTPIQRPHPVL